MASVKEISKMDIINPEDHRKYFDEIKSRLDVAPLTIAELCCLGHLVEQHLILERHQVMLFDVGDRSREHLRYQFFVLNQVLELDAIQIGPLFADRELGTLRWKIRHRTNRVNAVLALTAHDDSWSIERFPVSESRRGIMTQKEAWDTDQLCEYDLAEALVKRKVNLQSLGGWRFPE
jgi:hypothetical protein